MEDESPNVYESFFFFYIFGKVRSTSLLNPN